MREQWLPRDAGIAREDHAGNRPRVERLRTPAFGERRDRNARLVVSGHLVDRLSGDGRRRQAMPLGETALAGKSDPVAIFSVAPGGASAPAWAVHGAVACRARHGAASVTAR